MFAVASYTVTAIQPCYNGYQSIKWLRNCIISKSFSNRIPESISRFQHFFKETFNGSTSAVGFQFFILITVLTDDIKALPAFHPDPETASNLIQNHLNLYYYRFGIKSEEIRVNKKKSTDSKSTLRRRDCLPGFPSLSIICSTTFNRSKPFDIWDYT